MPSRLNVPVPRSKTKKRLLPSKPSTQRLIQKPTRNYGYVRESLRWLRMSKWRALEHGSMSPIYVQMIMHI